MLRRTLLLRRSIRLLLWKKWRYKYGINAVFWVWPSLTVGTTTATPCVEGSGGIPARPSQGAPRKAPDAEPQSVTQIAERASREMALHVTTTLSRSLHDLSRIFGRMRDAIAYERFMHATFGWALTPMQRLMPSAAWPLVYANFNAFGPPTRGAGPLAGAGMFVMGFDWWRSFTQPNALPHRGWQTLPPSPQPQRSSFSGGRPNDFAAFAFAPMIGFAAGLQHMMPGIAFALFS